MPGEARSVSTTPTDRPREASWAARLAVRLDLPEPPRKEWTDTTRIIEASSSRGSRPHLPTTGPSRSAGGPGQAGAGGRRPGQRAAALRRRASGGRFVARAARDPAPAPGGQRVLVHQGVVASWPASLVPPVTLAAVRLPRTGSMPVVLRPVP